MRDYPAYVKELVQRCGSFVKKGVNETALLGCSPFLDRPLGVEQNRKTISVTKVTLDGDKGPIRILFQSLSGEGPLLILFGT